MGERATETVSIVCRTGSLTTALVNGVAIAAVGTMTGPTVVSVIVVGMTTLPGSFKLL